MAGGEEAPEPAHGASAPDPGGVPTVTVGVATKNRLDALVRCLRSLRLLEGLVAEAVVVDDGSDVPVEGPARAALAADLPPAARFIRHEASRNLSACRNRIAREARTPWLLNLDDDAFVVSRRAVETAVAVLESDPSVAAVAFAQCGANGEPYGPAEQPLPVDYPAYAPTFIGYAHLLRRDAFLAVGGFRERMGINGEEKELSLRLLDRAWRVVYLPGACIAHVAHQGNRDRRRYLQQVARNDVLAALYDHPFPLVVAGAAVRLWRYFPMRKGWGIDDPGGFGTLVRGVARELPGVLRDRTPVRWSTLRRWRAMTGAAPEPYTGPGLAAAARAPATEPAA
ncbi:MAG TPA: glycosyltransferase [Longimicrobium sp.]|nr:glycosyltransferase [Longimicrobium sp.]